MSRPRTPGPIWIVVGSGSREGEVLRFDQDRVTLGRSHEADVRFDPERDRGVSAHQAVIARSDQGWFVRDLGSRNGTFVDGVRIDPDGPLRDGSEVTCGAEGPGITFRTSEPAGLGAAPSSSDEGVTRRIRAQVSRETRRLRLLVLALAATLLVVFITSRNASRERAAWEAERAELLQFVDSVLQEGDASGRELAHELDALASALAASQAQVRALRTELANTRRSEDASDTDSLRRELQEAALALQRQQLAAGVDHERIASEGESSVAAVWVELGPGEVSTATAFVVEPSLLVTSGHVLSGPTGNRRPRRIAVQFAGQRAVRAAEPVAVTPDVDLGLIRVLGPADTPAPLPLNARPDTIAEGRPAVLIGFPLGGAEPLHDATTRARPLRSVGVILNATAEELLIQGYGAEGASGSPVFDEHGLVIGVLRGGVQDAPVQTVVAVSSAEVREMLAAVPKVP